MAVFKETIFNNLRDAVTVVNRKGVRAKIPGTRAVMNGALTILEEQEFQFAVNLDTTELLNDCGLHTSELAKQIIETLGLQQRPRLMGTALPYRASIAHTITSEDLRRCGGTLYIPTLDLLISLNEPEHTPAHPFMLTTQREQLVVRDPLLSHTSGLHYHIRIVDRAGVFGERYVNLNGTVFRVPVVTEGSYQDGVYVISTHPYNGVGNIPYPRPDYYPFELAEKELSLYRTQVEAATLGDPQSAYKRELDAQKHKNQIESEALRQQRVQQDHEAEMLRRKHEREREEAKARLAEREEKIKEREAILDAMEREARIKEEQMKRDTLFAKEQFERSSHQRKVHLEIMKYVPSLIAGAYLTYKTIVKLNNANKK